MFENLSSPSADGVYEAARRIDGRAVSTPLIENEALNKIAGGRIFLKAEIFQRSGSFKFRGAFNLISQLSDAERAKGILAWSSGNHAQGVALAAKMFDTPATIVMPADAPKMKTENVLSYGAKIITYDRYSEDREEIARSILAEKDMILAPSYDHPAIIEGQGTVALECLSTLEEKGLQMDAFIACCGGGGLTSGCALALEAASPDTSIWISEPADFDDAWRSIQSGEIVRADVTKRTICDAIATPCLGELTFPILKRLVTGGVKVSDIEIQHAMAFAFKTLKLVVEPGGAAALAAILSGKFKAEGRNVVITLSGGNVDPSVFFEAVDNNL